MPPPGEYNSNSDHGTDQNGGLTERQKVNTKSLMLNVNILIALNLTCEKSFFLYTLSPLGDNKVSVIQ